MIKNRALKSAFTAFSAVAICLILALSSLTVYASESSEMLDPERLGSISLTFTYFEEESGAAIPVTNGNAVGLYRVADVVEDSGFKYVIDERFEAAGEIPATDTELDSANKKLAAAMAEIAKDYDYDKRPRKMDSEGKVSFDGLPVGLYLVVQSVHGTGDDQFDIQPFLVSVPYRNPDGSLNYDVDAQTKPIVINKNEEPPKKPDKRIPQTGQLWWPVMVLAPAGLLFVLAGCAAGRKK